MNIRFLIYSSVLLFICSPITALSQVSINSIQKISDTQGNFNHFLDNDDHFGSDISVIGDFNFDGIDDVIVGANNDDDGGHNRGAIYILLLNRDKSVLKSIKISDGKGNFSGLQNNDNFGIAVEAIGDLDKDGVMDVAVGAHYDGENGYQKGAVWVLFLNAEGTVKASQKISSLQGNLNVSFPDLASFGSAVCSLGDLDNDGVIDIAVGAYRDNTAAVKSGAVYILFLKPDGTVKRSQKIGEGFGSFTGKLKYEDYFGGQLTSIGDLDNDGVMDLAVSAFLDDDGGNNKGAVWILFLNADGTVKKNQKISATSGNFSGVLRNGDFFGSALAPLGDFDGDNIPDIAVGADRDDGQGTDRGAVWVLLLNVDGTVREWQKIGSSSECLESKLDDGDVFGGSLAVIQKQNGGLFPTIISAAVLDDDGGFNKGAIYFLGFETMKNSSAGKDKEVCQNYTVLSGTDPDNGNIGEWKVISGSGILLDPNNHDSEIQNLSPGQNKLVWTISNGCGVVTSDTTIVTFSDLEKELIAEGGEDQVVCQNYTFLTGRELSSESVGFWTVLLGNGMVLAPNDPASEVRDLSPGENRLIWTINLEECNIRKSDTVVIYYIHENKSILNGEDQEVCNSKVSLTSSFSETVAGKWTVISGAGKISEPEKSLTTAENLSIGVNTFKFTVNGVAGCQVVSYTVNYIYTPLTISYFPNIITPNGDGKNDVLEFKNIHSYPENKLTILNRWGKVLFEKLNYNNEWDAKGFEAGIYFIRLHINDCMDYKGWVQVLK